MICTPYGKILPEHICDALQTYNEFTRRLLYTRGITTQEEADIFLKKEWFAVNPYRYKDMRKAAQRLLSAITSDETVGIFSDYDCDGIPAAAALYSALNAFGHRNVVYYVPDRNTEGFGLNKAGVNRMIDGGVSVVCVLDCGTSSPNEIAMLENAGISTIILDHHLADEAPPEAFSLINPIFEPEVEKPHPCAAGITYIFIQALIQQAQNTPLKTKPQTGWEKWQLDIIGLATLSDMVPLRGINRQFAHYGLQVFRKSPRPGVQALCRALKIEQQKITQDDLSFLIIPKINAASRMGRAETAFTLLTTGSTEKAAILTKELITLNNKRKTAVATMVREAHKQAKNKNKEKEIWVFGNREWKPSLVGLVAQKLTEAYNKTMFVWGQGGDSQSQVIKGSCRSNGHDVFTLMQKLPDIFTEAGGHRRAGGFTLNAGAEIVVEDELNGSVIVKKQKPEELIVDRECTISDIPFLSKLCEKFSPFGAENESICVAIPKCRIHKQIRFGKNKDHIRYTFADETGYLDGISFFIGENKILSSEQNQTARTVIGRVEFNTFYNKPQIKVITFIH